MALLGMLRPGLPSVKHFYVISKDYDFFSNLLKNFFLWKNVECSWTHLWSSVLKL